MKLSKWRDIPGTKLHYCGRKDCSALLDQYHPYCHSHAVQVQRRNSNKTEYCSIYDVKIGDRVL